MHTEVERGHHKDGYRWLFERTEKKSSLAEMQHRFGIDGIIRIQAKDYPFFPEQDLFTHFNLQISHHIPGYIYALPKIIRPGFFIEPLNHKEPLLDFSQCKVGRCLSVREMVKYDKLVPEDFKDSFRHIRTIDELKKEMLWRYKQSMPALSDEKIFSLGVSITLLQIFKTLDGVLLTNPV